MSSTLVHARVSLSLFAGFSAAAGVSFQIDADEADRFTAGTGDNQATLGLEVADHSLAASASETTDVNTGATNPLGQSIAFTKVKAIYIENTGTTSLTIASTLAILPISATLAPGDKVLVSSPTGHSVGVGTDSVAITNNSSSTAGAYRMAIVGN